MFRKLKEYLSVYKEVVIKLLLSISVVLLLLTFGTLVASMFSLRPQTVLVLLSIGFISTRGVINVYERIVDGYEEPLPKYVLDEVEKSDREVEAIKRMISNSDRINITKDEVEVIAKKEMYKEDAKEDEQRKREGS